MPSFLIQVGTLKLAPLVSRSSECILARFPAAPAADCAGWSALGGVVGGAPVWLLPLPYWAPGGVSLLISMRVAPLIAETLLLCSKTLLSISLQYQRYSSLIS